MKLTPRRQRFVDEYLVDLNATQAAIRAGYSSKQAEHTGSRLYRNAQVSQAIALALAARSKRTGITADRVLERIDGVAHFDLADAYDAETNTLKPVHDLPRQVRDAVVGIKVHHDGQDEPGFTVELKLAPRLEALRDLGRHLKLFTDRIEHTAGSNFADALREARTRARRR